MSYQQEPWFKVLSEACKGTSQVAVARKIGYSAAVVNAVLKGSYQGDLKRVQRAIEGALMAAVVDCPIVGEIPQQRCIEHQRAPFAATSAARVQLYHACRGGCTHSLIESAGDAGKESS